MVLTTLTGGRKGKLGWGSHIGGGGRVEKQSGSWGVGRSVEGKKCLVAGRGIPGVIRLYDYRKRNYKCKMNHLDGSCNYCIIF